MINIFELIFFSLFTIFIFLNCISYAIYEIKQQNNKVGGAFVICFSLFCCILSNAIIFGYFRDAFLKNDLFH